MPEDFGGKMAESTKIEKTKKFSLIELIMIIMLVGIVFTLIIPLRADKLNHEKLKEAVYNMQVIAHADVDFKQDPANGYYIFDGTWNSLQNTASSGIITIDFTNASKHTGPSGSTTATCGSNPKDWFFAENSLADAIIAFEQCGVSEDADIVGFSNITTTGYVFNINF